MGLSSNPHFRRIQAKNRVQFLKGAITIVLGLTIVVLFIESLPQSKYSKSCNTETQSLRVRRQAETDNPTCLSKFQEQYGDDPNNQAYKDCNATLVADYGSDWGKKEVTYDCVYWCDTTDYPASIFTIRERK